MTFSTVLRDLRWWAKDYAYALAWQLAGLFAGRPKSYLSGDRRPIVVIPGIWESWTFMVPLIKPLHRAGHPVHVIAGLGLNRRSVVDTAAVVAEYLRVNDLRDVALVAHSKGGVIGKYVMTFFDPDDRIALMAAVAAPFNGSAYARYLILPSLRALSPSDPTTEMLTANTGVNDRVVSISGIFDPHIPEGSELAGATNVLLEDGGHFRLLGTREVVTAIVKAVEGRAVAVRPVSADGPAGGNDAVLRQLVLTLSLDAVCVLCLIVVSTVVAHHGPTALTLSSIGYASVGVAGLLLAVVAVTQLAIARTGSRVSTRRAARATGLLLGGLLVNTAGGVFVLVLSLAGAHLKGEYAVISAGLAVFLTAGGDILSAAYLVLVRAVEET